MNTIEKLINLKNVFEGNENFTPRSNMELSLFVNLFDDDEVPQKEFQATTKNTNNKSINGQIILTNKSFTFVAKVEEKTTYLNFKYKDMDYFLVGVNEKNKADGVFVICHEGLIYSFNGLMRFGLTQWEDYVNERIEKLREGD